MRTRSPNFRNEVFAAPGSRDYMRRHSAMAEGEIRSETVRYSCDLPAQALAYKLGDTFILGLRERMRAALSARFSLKAFHDLVLGCGALPMPELAGHLDHVIRSRRATNR